MGAVSEDGACGSSKYCLYIDLDGVLVDFDSGVLKVCGALPDELEARFMWPRLARSAGFYENLDWMRDGKDLWLAVRDACPHILTGLPMGSWAEGQKRAWCARELGDDVRVLTCKSREKASKAREDCGPERTPVLVDDRESLKDDWEAMGGVFIHHVGTPTSLSRLRELSLVS